MKEIEILKKISKGVSIPKEPPIYMSSVFSFDDVEALDAVYEGNAEGYVYSRMANPGTDVAGAILADIEEADGALVFSSGMAAIITSIVENVQAGDHIVSSPVLYGGVYDYFKNELPRFGIDVSFVDFEEPGALERAIKPNTKIVYTETISNPLMEVANIPEISKIAHRHGCKVIVDNTFATAAIIKPIQLGADIVVYSATKYLGGHSDLLGGAIVSDEKTVEAMRRYFTLYGAGMSPFDAWLLARSLRTLELRIERHSDNALEVAGFLESHPKVERVFYPGLDSSPYKALSQKLFFGGRCGGMLSINIAKGEEGVRKLIAACDTIKLVPSLAGVATTFSYPAKTSHRTYSAAELDVLGISMGQVRISVGLEKADRIIEELSRALEQI